MKNKLKHIFSPLVLSIIAVILLGHLVFVYLMLPGPLEEQKIIIIEPKTRIKDIAKTLHNEGVIHNRLVFNVIAKFYSKFRNPLRSGEYEFTTHITPLQVIRILSSGKSVIHKLVIPEGSTVAEIITKLESEHRFIGAINENVEEGFLMPSTYFYTFRDQRSKLISHMKGLMSDALDELMPQLSKDSPLKTRLDVLTLASIVEKEAMYDDEKPHIAGVFINRLSKKMRLQADPTTIYAITLGKYKLDHPLTKKELQINSQYNTYYATGLPPTPISCPGRKAIEAVISPLQTNDLYFVVDGTGRHNFSSSLEAHKINIALYKKTKSTKKD
jgi:UPF0755 protein